MACFNPPSNDPTPFFDLVRGNLATELLASGVIHFDVPGRLAKGPKTSAQLQSELGLADRAWVVLSTALKAMNILEEDFHGNISLTPAGAEFLTDGEFDMKSYIGLIAETPGVHALLGRLKNNAPTANRDDEGDAFIFREGKASAMDSENSARRLTLALSGRARICGSAVAKALVGAGCKRILDVGGGSGLYAIALLLADENLRVTVWDRAEVLRLAAEFGAKCGVAHRMDLVSGDMFADSVPEGHDGVLLSNILHDWDIPECERLLKKLRDSVELRTPLWIHDVYLNDSLDGPLPIALYSAALFSLTEGRAYSTAEYRTMLRHCGFLDQPAVLPTAVHCGVLTARAV
jgi:hypothetical protein